MGAGIGNSKINKKILTNLWAILKLNFFGLDF